jgi:uncharacterized protein YecT (DUF1311 family)
MTLEEGSLRALRANVRVGLHPLEYPLTSVEAIFHDVPGHRITIMKKLLSLALLFSAPLSLEAQTPSPAPGPSCVEILARPFTPGLDPRVEDNCDATALYYGIGREKDYAAARACAQIERYKHLDTDGNIFAGPGVLSMLYANGEGGPRDVELARRFVCENKGAAPAEIVARLRVLDRIAANPLTPPRLDLCATATTGPAEGWCAAVQVRLRDAKRYDELVVIFNALTPQQQEAFKALQTAEIAFEDLRGVKEIDQTGTARAAFTLAEQDRLRAQFVSDLKLFASPAFKQPVTLAVAEAKMQSDLATLRLGAPKLFVNTTLTLEGVEETQRAWLKLRESWRSYGGAAYPTVGSDAIATQITRERLYQLRKLSTP